MARAIGKRLNEQGCIGALPSGSLPSVAITGANGFIGKHLVQAMQCEGYAVLPLVRRLSTDKSQIAVDLSTPDAVARVLKGVDVLVHCAGYAHAHEEVSRSTEEKHQLINCEYALNAARAAARVGVRRFVFCSSVKAMGEPGDQCVDESFDAPAQTSYGLAKRAAELGLAEIGAVTGLQVVVLRLAMVYGAGSRGNLERMLRLVAQGWFPPLPDTGNQRSLVHVSDAVSALILATQHPMAAGRTYIVAHPSPISGRALYQQMRSACSMPPSNWAVPAWLLRLSGRSGDAIGQVLGARVGLDSQAVDRLLNSTYYSSAALQTELGWEPRVDIAAGIKDLLNVTAAQDLD